MTLALLEIVEVVGIESLSEVSCDSSVEMCP